MVVAVSPSPRRVRAAHSLARFACAHMPLPMFWVVENVMCRALVPSLRGAVRCPTMYGFDLVVRASDGAQYHRCGFYEQGTMHAIASCLRSGDVFVDAGASVGQMSFHAARQVGHDGLVLAFEPARARWEGLQAGIALNELRNVRAFQHGLAAAAADVELYLIGRPSMAARARSRHVETVHVRALDAVLDELGVARVRMMKIDVEGFEYEVLAGARRLLSSPEPPIVCYEHGIYRAARDIPEALHEWSRGGYQFFQLAKSMHRPSRLRMVDPRRFRADNVLAVHRDAVGSLPAGLRPDREGPSRRLR